MLSLIVFSPILFSLLLLPLKNRKVLDGVAFALSLVSCALVGIMASFFNTKTPALQFVEKYMWFEPFSISYFLGIDGISFWLVVLTAFFFPVLILATWGKEIKNANYFYAALFALQTTLSGTFLAMDAILFYTFFELSLIPMYFLVGVWGGSRRIYSSLKLFIYTGAGSLCFLVATVILMYLHKVATGQVSASIPSFYTLDLPFVAGHFFNFQTIIFALFFVAFAVKVPLFPLHTWLPDVHVEAPTAGSAILAAVMLKMGAYGFLRFVLPICPDASVYYGPLVIFIGVVGVIYGAMMALVQTDIKKIIAFSSISHMGYVVIGFFTVSGTGLWGAYFQMLAHAVSSGCLFLLIGFVYDKYHTRELKDFGGLAKTAPLFSVLFFIMTLSSIGVPGTAGFVGEFLVMIAAFKMSPVLGGILLLGVVLGAAYMLLAFKKMFWGEVSSNLTSNPWDLPKMKVLLFVPMVALIFIMGLFPNLFYSYSKESLDFLQKNYRQYYLENDRR